MIGYLIIAGFTYIIALCLCMVTDKKLIVAHLWYALLTAIVWPLAIIFFIFVGFDKFKEFVIWEYKPKPKVEPEAPPKNKGKKK